MRHVVHQRVGGAHQVVESSVTACLELHLEAARRTQAGDDRRGGQVDLALGIFTDFAADGLHHLVDGGIVALLPRFQNDGQLAACLAGAHTRTGARHILYILHSRLFHQEGDGALGHVAGTLQRSALGQLQLDGKVALVFDGQEAGGRKAVQDEDAQQADAEVHGDAARMLHGAADNLDVFCVANGQPLVDKGKYPVLGLVGILGFQDERTHHRAQSQCHDGGQEYRYYDGHRELTVELACNAR